MKQDSVKIQMDIAKKTAAEPERPRSVRKSELGSLYKRKETPDHVEITEVSNCLNVERR